jgi:ATP-dependent DNA ligase
MRGQMKLSGTEIRIRYRAFDLLYIFGSDAIFHSYSNQKRKECLTKQIPEEVNELFNSGSNIGSYIIVF